jgi:hypothetical protein
MHCYGDELPLHFQTLSRDHATVDLNSNIKTVANPARNRLHALFAADLNLNPTPIASVPPAFALAARSLGGWEAGSHESQRRLGDWKILRTTVWQSEDGNWEEWANTSATARILEN